MRRGPSLSWRCLAAITAGTVAVRLPTLLSSRWYDPDEASIAMAAQAMQRGGRLYVDMADRKPPIPAMVNRWSFELFSGPDPRPVRVLLAGIMVAVTVAVGLDGTRRWGRAGGCWAAALYGAGAIAFMPGDGGAANFAQFALPAATLAILALRRRGLWWSLAGGALVAVAVLARQSWVFCLPAAALSAWMATRWRGVVTAAAAFAGVIASVGWFVPWHRFWFWTFASAPSFVFAGAGILGVVWRALASVGIFVAFHLVQVAGAARGRRTWRDDADLWGWVLTGVAATAAGFRFFGHYWLQVVAPLALLATPAVVRAGERWRRRAASGLAATSLVAGVFLWMPGVFRHRHDPAAVASAVQRLTSAEQRVFIWGNDPELAVAVDRPIAGTQVHSDFVTGRSGGRTDGPATLRAATPGALEWMVADLRAAPPAVIVDTSTAADLHYGAYPITLLAPIADLVRTQYRAVAVVDGCTLYAHR